MKQLESTQISADGLSIAKNTRNYAIDFLRFLFALVIVHHHFFHISGVLTEEEAAHFWFFHGNNAVEFFFLVSGYLMAVTAFRVINRAGEGISSISIGEETVSFMKRKIGSIILPIILAWIFSFVMFQAVDEDASLHSVISHLNMSVFELLLLRNAGFRVYASINQTWYISAMVLTMALCYPLLLKLKKTYLYIIAPLTAIFILGYMNHEYARLVNINAYTGVLYKCQLRAIAEINLGVTLYALTAKLKDTSFTKFGIFCLSAIEILCYVYAFYYMIAVYSANSDYVFLVILACAVCITFSQKTYLYKAFTLFPQISDFLGRFSLPLYLTHCAIVNTVLYGLWQKFGMGIRFYVYGVGIIVGVALIMMLLTHIIKKWVLPFLKNLIFQQA